MNQNYQWNDNLDEPGLFTFYYQQQAQQVINKSRKTEQRYQIPTSRPNQKISFKKTKPEQRYATAYSHWSISNQIRNRNKISSSQRNNLSEKKIKKSELVNEQTEAVSQIKIMKDYVPGHKNKTQLELKKRNMNQCFRFDINRRKNRMFIFRGEPVRLVNKCKAVSKQPQNFNQSEEKTKIHLKNAFSLNKQQRIINSDSRNIINGNVRCNFVQFLLERRKRKNLANIKERIANNVDLKLTRLMQLNRPQLQSISYRCKTEK